MLYCHNCMVRLALFHNNSPIKPPFSDTDLGNRESAKIGPIDKTIFQNYASFHNVSHLWSLLVVSLIYLLLGS